MQRTVHGTRYTYPEMVKSEDGFKAEIKAVTVAETDEKRAYKMAVKQVGHGFQILAKEEVTELWILPDEIFFKYATKADPKIATETAE